MGRHPLTARTLRLRAGLQEGDEEAATSLCPAPPASSVASAAPPGCSRLLSALSRLPAAPAWARRRRRVGAAGIGIRGSASTLLRVSGPGSRRGRRGPPQVALEAGKGGGCLLTGRRRGCERGPGGGPAGVTFGDSETPSGGTVGDEAGREILFQGL